MFFQKSRSKRGTPRLTPDTKKRLQFSEVDFLLDEDHGVEQCDYPNFIHHHDQRLTLTYEFDLASERDGITVTVPLASLNGFSDTDFDYLVPAMLPDKITALMKSLPKRYRRQFVPVAPYVEAIMTAVLPHVADEDSQNIPLIEQIITVLEQQTTIKLTPDLFAVEKLDKHYLMNIAVTNKHGKVVAESRDLSALQAEFHDAASDDFNRSTQHVFAEVFKEAFPKHIAETHKIKGKKLTAYPALIEVGTPENNQFKIELFDSPDKAHTAHERGVLAFVKQGLNKEIAYIKKQVLNNPKITLAYRALTIDDKANNNLLDDMVDAVLLQSYLRELPRDEKAYQTVILAAKKTLVAEAQCLTKTILTLLTAHREAREQMKPNWAYFADVDAQLNRLVYAGFISATPIGKLPDVARYLQGIVIRLQKAHLDPQKDTKWQTQVEPFTRKLTDKIGNKRLDKSLSPEILEFSYLLEEYRLSVFAQGQVKVVGKVSAKRLNEGVADL